MKTLSFEESMAIYGGAPTKDTSFAYDVSYYVTKACMWVSDLF